MESNYIHHQLNLKAQKRVQDIKGFYTHLVATFFIPPFLVFINLQLAPEFIWFWYAFAAWFVGLFIHWINVFGITKFSFKEDWKERKMKELLGDDLIADNNFEEPNYIQEQYFIKAKKEAKDIKGFYIHLFVNIFSLAIVIFVNLKFVPGFHFFWFVLGGMFLGLFFHWLGVFGFNLLGLGKKWEEKKVQEIIQKNTL